MAHPLLLVGSIPLDTVESVFMRFGRTLGPHLDAMPDGEVGLRRHWISRVHYQVLALHPDIEVVRQPQKDDDVERLHPRSAADSWQFRVRTGAGAIRFGEPGWRLGFARDAVNSYFVFKTLRERAVLSPRLRFQVAMPSVASAVPPRIFPRAADLPIVRAGYAEALQRELATIIEHIPARDLAIQWDCATEVQEAHLAGANAANVASLAAISRLVPAEAALGIHLCFGTLGGWPRFQPESLAAIVTLANLLIDGSGRQLDWLHIPLLDRADDAFLAPLAQLQPGATRIYLGAIHNMERFVARVATARKYLPEFGLGGFCGFGRMAPAELDRVLAEHVTAAGQ